MGEQASTVEAGEEKEKLVKIGKYPIRVVKEVPPIVPFLAAAGPAIIEVGLALGSGETIIWPTLAAKYGLILVWGTLVGLFIQTVWTQEMGRWTIVSGEHHIQGAGRVIGMQVATWLFLFLGYIAFIWPGWITGGSAAFLKLVHNWPAPGYRGILFWSYFWSAIIFAAVLLSPVARRAVELLELGTLILAWIIIITVAVTATHGSDWVKMLNYMFLHMGARPKGLDWWTFAASIAFVGAGGLANIWYTFWLRDAKFGMGKYIGTIPGITGKPTALDPIGAIPEGGPENAERIRKWKSHHLKMMWYVFFLGNFLTVLIFIMISYSLLYSKGITPGMGVGYIKGHILQLTADAISKYTILGKFGGAAYLLSVWLILFNTQVALMEGLVRQAADTLYVTYESVRRFVKQDIRKWYAYWWIGIIIVEFGLVGAATLKHVSYGSLVVFGAVMALLSMIISPAITIYINTKLLKKLPEDIYEAIKPHPVNIFILAVAVVFYAFFFSIAVAARLHII